MAVPDGIETTDVVRCKKRRAMQFQELNQIADQVDPYQHFDILQRRNLCY
jgi:hypothetical protein